MEHLLCEPRHEGSVMCVEWYFTTFFNQLRKTVIYFLLIFYIFNFSKEFTAYILLPPKIPFNRYLFSIMLALRLFVEYSKYRVMKKLSILALVVIATGCASINESRKSAGISRQSLYTAKFNDGTKEKVLPTLFWSHYDATQRGGIYLVNANGTVKVISENPPDAVINSTLDVLAKAKVGDKVDAAAKFSAVKAIAELGKRNAGNYMIRDLAFRIEALKNNEGEVDPAIIKIYEKLITSAEKIAIADSKNQVYHSKKETLKELTELIKLSKDTLYQDLKIDSTFIKKIGKYINEE